MTADTADVSRAPFGDGSRLTSLQRGFLTTANFCQPSARKAEDTMGRRYLVNGCNSAHVRAFLYLVIPSVLTRFQPNFTLTNRSTNSDCASDRKPWKRSQYRSCILRWDTMIECWADVMICCFRMVILFVDFDPKGASHRFDPVHST